LPTSIVLKYETDEDRMMRLHNLHSDIRRLAALVFSDMEYRSREMISRDYFLDALADPDFALKVRKRHLKDLDSALRIAL